MTGDPMTTPDTSIDPAATAAAQTDPPHLPAAAEGVAGTLHPNARPPRVPNVSAGAVSGLDHEPIGADAVAAFDANTQLDAGINPDTGRPLGDPDGEDPADETPALEVPAGTDEERVSWVAAGETLEDRRARADAVSAHAQAAGTDDQTLEVLYSLLRDAVYGEPTSTEQVPGPDTPEGAVVTGSADQGETDDNGVQAGPVDGVTADDEEAGPVGVDADPEPDAQTDTSGAGIEPTQPTE